ncbi:MAG: DUF3810 domain-containing protein [Roseburia sp.]|nr:DUF3810 domain-containing protein [Roseburia sp.]
MNKGKDKRGVNIMKGNHQGIKPGRLIFGGIVVLIVVLNILSWLSSAFTDAYITYIFPIWVNTYGRLTGLFPFSVGECLIVAGLVLVGAAVLFGPVALAVCLVKRSRQRKQLSTVGCERWQKSLKIFYTFFVWTLLIVCLIMTLNCFVLYHASTFSETYFKETKEACTEENLVALWNEIAENCNRLSARVERDGAGRILYPGSILEDGRSGDMQEQAIESMQRLGRTYSRLSGYYPRPKSLFASDFMCQQYMEGYYFPFSMEANYNDVMYVMNKPSSMCHELAHLHGYILEDEANFISFLACVESEDIYFQYSGYLSVMNYVARELTYIMEQDASFGERGYTITGILPQVQQDNIFVLEEDWERIEEKAILETETVDKAADVFLDTTLKVNGVSDGMKSYSRVVQLLLCYYQQR